MRHFLKITLSGDCAGGVSRPLLGQAFDEGVEAMAKVIGVGGVFVKSKDPKALLQWYVDVLGMQLEPWGGVVLRPEAMANHPGAATVFNPFKADTDYFSPSANPYMINLVVDDLEGVLANCRKHGVTP